MNSEKVIETWDLYPSMKISHSAYRWPLVFAAVLFFSLMTHGQNRPNIVLIMADDLGHECISANGSEDYQTPVLDRMAKEGVRFTQCFANPLCTPSRVKLMTGMYNIRNYDKFGVMNRDQVTFAHVLKKAGYITGVAGKWQLGHEPDSPQHFGFDQACLWQHTRGNTQTGMKNDSRYPNPQIEINGKAIDYRNGEYGPDVCTDFICDFIAKNKSQPFFAYCPMILTHCPFDATPDSKDWDPKSLGSLTYKGPGDYENQKKHFKDMVEYHDKLVGKIIETLEKNGLGENTIIIYTGDNGTDKPIKTKWKGREVAGGKGTLQDNGTRVPLIIRWPGKIQPKVDEKELVEFSDILPTLCEIGGAELPTNYPGDGVSLMPALLGKGERKKDNIFITWQGEAWARNVDYGVRIDLKSNVASYERFKGHFDKEPFSIETADQGAKETLQKLELTARDLLKQAKPAKKSK